MNFDFDPNLVKVELKLGAFHVKGVPSPESSPVIAREMACEISDTAHWRGDHKNWVLPATSKTALLLEKRLGIKVTGDNKDFVDYLAKVNEAQKKACAFMELPLAEQQAFLDKIGVRCKEPLLDHQVASVGFSLIGGCVALFLDTGTGKTCVAATIMQSIKDRWERAGSQGERPKFLAIAPKSIVRVGWGADVEKFTWLTWTDLTDAEPPPALTVCPRCGRDFKDKPPPKAHLKTHLKVKIDMLGEEKAFQELYAKVPGLRPRGAISREERVEALLNRKDIDLYVINPEQLKINAGIFMRHKFSLIVVDESSMMRDHSSQTTKTIVDLGDKCKRKIVMSGTPRPNSSRELWGQFAFVDYSLGPVYSKFRDKYFESDQQGWNWRERPGMEEELRRIIFGRAIRYRLEDCVDLPGEQFEDHEVDLTPEIKAHYKTMLKEMMVELEDDTIATPYKLVQINKLAQIASGFIYDKEKNAHYLGDSNPKVNETVATARRLIEDENRSIVIWIRFSDTEGRLLQEKLKKFGVSVLWGGMNPKQIEKSVTDFKSGINKVMIAHPLSAKFGHTWTQATISIFHSYDFSWENYYQARHRIYRYGQKEKVVHINIVARRTVDSKIIRRLLEKEQKSAMMIDREFIESLKEDL
jgi:SNF2 family DNA or RNA helicase